jgi:hypothetical protein
VPDLPLPPSSATSTPSPSGPRGLAPRSPARALQVPLSFVVGFSGLAILLIHGWSLLALLAVLGGFGTGLVLKLITGIERQALNAGDSDAGATQALKQGLFKAQYTPGADKLAEQAIEQLKQLEARYKDFVHILGEKLSPTELTYARYLGVADQVHQSVLDHLRQILSELRSFESSDPTYAENRRKTLNAQVALSESDETELKTIKERLSLHAERVIKIRGFLGDNEKALTQFDLAISAIGAMNTGARLTSTDLVSALQDLEEIARRAKKFQS